MALIKGTHLILVPYFCKFIMYIYVMRGFYVSMSLLNPSHFLFFAYSLSLYIYSENLYTPSSLKLKQVPACLGLTNEAVTGYLILKLPLV